MQLRGRGPQVLELGIGLGMSGVGIQPRGQLRLFRRSGRPTLHQRKPGAGSMAYVVDVRLRERWRWFGAHSDIPILSRSRARTMRL